MWVEIYARSQAQNFWHRDGSNAKILCQALAPISLAPRRPNSYWPGVVNVRCGALIGAERTVALDMSGLQSIFHLPQHPPTYYDILEVAARWYDDYGVHRLLAINN